MNQVQLIKGVNGGGRAHFLYEIFLKRNKFLLVVLNNDEEIENLSDDLVAIEEFFKVTIKIKDKILNPSQLPLKDIEKKIITVFNLKKNQTNCLITSRNAIKQKLTKKDEFNEFNISVGERVRYCDLLNFLITNNYIKSDFVEDKGQFALRGEIIDFWSFQDEFPIRVVFSENRIESIRNFDVFTQRSEKFLSSTTILPASIQEDTYVFDYLPKDMFVYTETGNLQSFFSSQETIIKTDEFETVEATTDLGFVKNVSYGGNINFFINDLKKYCDEKFQVVIFCQNEGEKERILDIIDDHKLLPPVVVIPSIHEGCINYQRKLVFISFREIFSRYERPFKLPKFKIGRKLEGLWEISPGDFVVHENYGIGKFKGLKKIKVSNFETECLTLEYKGGDFLYVPVTLFNRVQKYIGIEGKRPALSSLNTFGWKKIKLKAKEHISEIAKELFSVYSVRKKVYRKHYQENNYLEEELANSFLYTETPDQMKAIKEIESDMYKDFPMDRLVLGDVGFGKTEVALRAAFKCVNSSRQVVFLCPTTVLAVQHYQTFSERLAAFPVKIALLTRFQNRKEQAKIIEETRKGIIDIVIGTHRLLQKDVEFKNLGLLIIDDEHKFGVGQKEKIKILKKNIDVLTLTATPIPRTLSISLSGLKDISLIETPPEGRLPIETYILPYSEEVIRDAIMNEISREGQIFYLYNLIDTIEWKKEKLSKILPTVKIEVVHGRMKPQWIERIMWEFINKKIDCLISTTIIEAGIDIPNVNTMIVEKAENFGLAQLYQLRGRIGRSARKAFCYLFYSDKDLTEGAKKRLEAVKEFVHMGSGMRLALRDLEIRGAGEVLGLRQHGFISDIGLELFSKMLKDEINILREEKKVEIEPEIDITLNASIPVEYIPFDDLRIHFYKKILSVENKKEIEEIKVELIDRFGRLPEEVENLLRLAKFKLLLKYYDIKRIVEDTKGYIVEFSEEGENKSKFLVKKLAAEFLTPKIMKVNSKDIISDFLKL